MTVVSTKEFNTNQDKYFDMALDEQVFVKRGNSMFHILCSNIDATAGNVVCEKVYFEPDEDFYNSIPIDELHRRVKADIHQWYKERNGNNSLTESTAIS